VKKWFLLLGIPVVLTFFYLLFLSPERPDNRYGTGTEQDTNTTDSQTHDSGSIKQKGLTARIEDVPYGCLTYGIDETSLEEVHGIMNVKFAQLGKWEENELCRFPEPPPEIAALHEKRIYIVGFMYPLESGKMIGSFKLMRSTQTCCWGPSPDYNQFALVTMAEGKTKFERITPVAVIGKFFVECKPRWGYIYRIEANHVEAAVKDEQSPQYNNQAITEKGLTKLDFSLIEKLGPQLEQYEEIKEWPEELLKLEGKKVFAEGYIIVRLPPPFGSKKEKLIISKYPNAEDARLSNSVYVRFKEDEAVPTLWATRTAVTGVLRIHKRWQSWQRSGIIMIDRACQGLPDE
jgi:hypothetical protein